MTREEYKIKVTNITKLGMDIHKTAQALFMASEEYIKNLQATIEAQEIIIKDKTAIMEAMAQPKTCDGCEWYRTDDDFPYCYKYENDASLVCDRLNFRDMYEPKAQP